ncbi:MAG: hypothetical protein HN403_11470 [Rhodospirillales bacterium]|jgi:hypothetical protein|nr:hypothetical protein [Rhodospirillales bacterium]
MTDTGINETSKREVVGVFSEREQFEAAIGALMEAGFERSDLSVFGSHDSLDAAGQPSKPWKDAITALVGEMKFEVPLVASGAIFLAGGATAAMIAGLIGAAMGAVAFKEIFDEATAAPQAEHFARSLGAGSVILWVHISHGEKEALATTILNENGGANVHTHRLRKSK